MTSQPAWKPSRMRLGDGDGSLAGRLPVTLREVIEGELRARGWVCGGNTGMWRRIRDGKGVPLPSPTPLVPLGRAVAWQMQAEDRPASTRIGDDPEGEG